MKKTYLILVLLFSATSFFGASTSPKFSSLILLNDEKQLEKNPEPESSLTIKNVQIPGNPENLNRYLTPYYGHSLSGEEIQKIKGTVLRYFEKQGYPFVIIYVPKQKVSSGVLQLVVKNSSLGQILWEGNRYAPLNNIKRYVKLQPGDRIDQNQLIRSVDFINMNPFRAVNVIYSPGEEEYTTDLTFKVQSRKPYRFYAGTDNTGVPTTGRKRFFLGFNWDQMFGFDQFFSYQYTSGYNTKKFRGHTFQYTCYLSNLMLLNLFGGYSKVRANIHFPNRSNKGKNIQTSARLVMPFLPSMQRHQEFTFGFDWKNTNNLIQYVDLNLPTLSHSVNLTQFVFGYRCSFKLDRSNISCGFETFASPGEWLPDQSDALFSALRPGAKNTWIYARSFLDYQLQGKFFSYALNFQGQITSNTLLPSEELGIGGYASVRGYDERQFNADTGFFISQDLLFPPYSFFKKKKFPDQFKFLVFLDAGWGTEYRKIGNLSHQEYLIGVGPGARYQLNENFTARFDWGFKLHHQKDFTGGNSMIHFSVIGSF